MKLFTTAFLVLPLAAQAGGLSPVITQEQAPAPQFTWSGFYAGGSVGRLEYDETYKAPVEVDRVEIVDDEVTYTCPYDPETKHYGQKCDVRDLPFPVEEVNHLPNGNWRHCDAPVCVYSRDENGNAQKLWLEGKKDYTFPVRYNRRAEIFTEIVSMDFTRAVQKDTIGAFAGYREDLGGLVWGAEISAAGTSDSNEVLTTATLHAGWDLGSVLVYAGAGAANFMDETTPVGVFGADIMVTESIGIGSSFMAGGEIASAGVRAFWKF